MAPVLDGVEFEQRESDLVADDLVVGAVLGVERRGVDFGEAVADAIPEQVLAFTPAGL